MVKKSTKNYIDIPKKGQKRYSKSAPNVPKSTIKIPKSTKKKYKPNSVFNNSVFP